jgi:hypothetical protein
MGSGQRPRAIQPADQDVSEEHEPRGETRRQARERETAERAEALRHTTTLAFRMSGGVFTVLGLYFLLAPGLVGSDYSNAVNMHRLTMGETFTIAGVILQAAGWWPHRHR